ncbi:MAG: cobyric acid synthase [Sulfurimonadaceae bacterium]|jgi:adenosylcobyric acid synthase|nr:cobyric acid synthase [Sulfurimonadaceae bacterium]
MNSLSIFGTGSDAGKSTLAFALTYLVHQHGIRVAPFKAQNISNNSAVADDFGEIAIAQHFAAEAIGIKTSIHMNPILIKSGHKNAAHLIVNGKDVGEKELQQYYDDIDLLKPYVKKSFKKLQKKYDCIIAEGAGSPVELNIMEKDLSNIYVAQEFNTKIILVADIERGGVFASIFGVYALLPKKLKKNVIGVIINKFRGDISLFDDGVAIIEERFGLKVLGVIPYKPFNLGFEDIQSLANYTQNLSKALLRVGVIKLPHISNFNDFEPLIADEELEVSFITHPSEAQSCDVVIVPGSKRVVDDLAWLKERGFEPILLSKEKYILAICGGYEMMHEHILDPWHVESSVVKTEGFGRVKGDVVFEKEKIVTKGTYRLLDAMVDGYEIHNGVSKKRAKKGKNFYGTFLHGFFENDLFRYELFHALHPEYKGYVFKEYKQNAIREFTAHVEEHLDMGMLLDHIKYSN